MILVLVMLALCLYFALTKLNRRPSRVYVKANKLILERRLRNGSLSSPAPFVIKGVTWSPATRAPASGKNPLAPKELVDYGYFFDWDGRNPQGHVIFNYWIKEEIKARYKTDIALMKQMNISAARTYSDFEDRSLDYNAILDEFYNNDIMVIMTLNLSKEDIITHSNGTKGIAAKAQLFKAVEHYKNHPAILMWSIGNEWNFNKYYGNLKDEETAIKLTNILAREIKKKDPYHPVGSCLGDAIVIDNANPCRSPEAATVPYILERCPDIEIWGINVYRGISFHGIFEQWKGISNRPFYISEFGTDSFRTGSFQKFKPESPCDYRITQCAGRIDEDLQATTDLGLWEEIESHLAVHNPQELCQGGLVHEFNDELWKAGSYHVGLGDLIDYKSGEHSYDQYNCEGISIGESHPDKVANEEYFGLVDAKRRPKKAYYILKDKFESFSR